LALPQQVVVQALPLAERPALSPVLRVAKPLEAQRAPPEPIAAALAPVGPAHGHRLPMPRPQAAESVRRATSGDGARR
jgi:hypothetical protein